MEPLITIEGYTMMQSSEDSRNLLNDYYRRQGYEVVTPKTYAVDDHSVNNVNSKGEAHQENK